MNNPWPLLALSMSAVIKHRREAFQQLPQPFQKHLLTQGITSLNEHYRNTLSELGVQILALRLALRKLLQYLPRTIRQLRIVVPHIQSIRETVSEWCSGTSCSSDCRTRLTPPAKIESLLNICEHLSPTELLENHPLARYWYEHILRNVLLHAQDHFLTYCNRENAKYYSGIYKLISELSHAKE